MCHMSAKAGAESKATAKAKAKAQLCHMSAEAQGSR